MKFSRGHFLLVALFAAGTAFGFVGSRFCHFRHGPHFGPPGPPPNSKEMMLQRLTDELNLTEQQAASLEPIVASFDNEVRKIHTEVNDRITAVIDGSARQVEPVLNPEQLKRFRELIERLKRRGPPP